MLIIIKLRMSEFYIFHMEWQNDINDKLILVCHENQLINNKFMHISVGQSRHNHYLNS